MAETKHKGDVGEAFVIANLIQLGYNVCVPFGENQPYDLVVDTGDRFVRVQVKYSTLKSDGILSCKCRTLNGRHTTFFTEKNIDVLAVYEPTTGKIVYLPSEMLNSAEVWLRTTPPKKNDPRCRMIDDYLCFEAAIA